RMRPPRPTASHVEPSGEVRMLPAIVPAAHMRPFQATEVRDSVAPDAREVQSVPFVEVRMVPEAPTAIHLEPFHATALSCWVVPDVCEIQSAPFSEALMTPALPTGIHVEPFHATARKWPDRLKALQ